jgi:hypothetical protein
MAGIAIALLLLFVALRSSIGPASIEASERWPDPVVLDSLGRYLVPVQPIPAVDPYEIYLPAELPPLADVAPAPVVRDWEVGAILIVGGRASAIIDDQQVREGDRLPDGSIVESIAADHVIIRTPDGQRRTLSFQGRNE